MKKNVPWCLVPGSSTLWQKVFLFAGDGGTLFYYISEWWRAESDEFMLEFSLYFLFNIIWCISNRVVLPTVKLILYQETQSRKSPRIPLLRCLQISLSWHYYTSYHLKKYTFIISECKWRFHLSMTSWLATWKGWCSLDFMIRMVPSQGLWKAWTLGISAQSSFRELIIPSQWTSIASPCSWLLL